MLHKYIHSLFSQTTANPVHWRRKKQSSLHISFKKTDTGPLRGRLSECGPEYEPVELVQRLETWGSDQRLRGMFWNSVSTLSELRGGAVKGDMLAVLVLRTGVLQQVRNHFRANRKALVGRIWPLGRGLVCHEFHFFFQFNRSCGSTERNLDKPQHAAKRREKLTNKLQTCRVLFRSDVSAVWYFACFASLLEVRGVKGVKLNMPLFFVWQKQKEHKEEETSDTLVSVKRWSFCDTKVFS